MRQNSNISEKNNDDITKDYRMAFMKQLMKSNRNRYNINYNYD